MVPDGDGLQDPGGSCQRRRHRLGVDQLGRALVPGPRDSQPRLPTKAPPVVGPGGSQATSGSRRTIGAWSCRRHTESALDRSGSTRVATAWSADRLWSLESPTRSHAGCPDDGTRHRLVRLLLTVTGIADPTDRQPAAPDPRCGLNALSSLMV